MFTCHACQADPKVHSFYSIEDSSTHTTYYSCENDIKDTNIERIVQHIEGYLQHHTTKQWSWVMDAKEFTLGWSSKDLAYAVLDIIEKYKSTLVRVRMINMSNLMKKIFKFGKSFLEEPLQSVFELEEE